MISLASLSSGIFEHVCANRQAKCQMSESEVGPKGKFPRTLDYLSEAECGEGEGILLFWTRGSENEQGTLP